MTVESILQKWAAKLSVDAELAAKIQGSFCFSISGEQGGNWVLQTKPEVVLSSGVGDADCIIEVDAGNFLGMISKSENPQVLYSKGLLRFHGDRAKALPLFLNLITLA